MVEDQHSRLDGGGGGHPVNGPVWTDYAPGLSVGDPGKLVEGGIEAAHNWAGNCGLAGEYRDDPDLAENSGNLGSSYCSLHKTQDHKKGEMNALW